MAREKLPPMQEAFVREYLVDLNATQAAVRAGYSAKTAHSQGPRLLENVGVRAAIDEATKAKAKRNEIDSDLILKELLKLATSDIREAFDESGSLLPIHSLPDGLAMSLSSIDIEELYEGSGRERVRVGDTKKFRMYDKLRALELLGKHLKLFTDKVELDVTDALADRLSNAMKRANGESGT